MPLSKKVLAEPGYVIDYVDLKKLPEFQKLNTLVTSFVERQSWWQLYGIDACLHLTALFCWMWGYIMLSSDNKFVFYAGVLLLGYCHSTICVKAAHCAVHESLCKSKFINRICSFIFSDILGTFSGEVGYDMHVKGHHPHTNIIGLGDSSTFKAPIVPRFIYMFITPLLVPFLSPFVSLKELVNISFLKTIRYIIIASLGLFMQLYFLNTISKIPISNCFGVLILTRSVLAIPYIHVNIFQHIGLPMYSRKHRPKRIYQMTSGVLNLKRNLLDYCFGHGIISCHVEHHLFPRLSDNMCLAIKPIVRRFCTENGLSYQEDSYKSRTRYFLDNYNMLMVHAPPITKFVGLQ